LNLYEIISSADLGGSSNYSKESRLRKVLFKCKQLCFFKSFVL